MCFEDPVFKKLSFSLLELYETLELAKQQSAIKSHILAKVCHQLRTPLNVISFSNSLIQKNIDNIDPKDREITINCLDNIQTATQQIIQILDDIFMLLEIEAKKVEFESTNVNLLDFCKNIIEKLHILHSDKHIKITVKGDYSSVYIYQNMLKPILDNLLDNALKYSSENSVVNLRISCSQQKITFKIKDQGIGISKSDQQKLFQPFYRGVNVGTIPGTGLGLSIVQTLVELYKGNISVVSKLDLGTTVTLVIPSIQPMDLDTS
ncbi:HAMP domain-containing sensor histidine kinase [Okeanomitos corallinicola TIOX110]|uniref:histidine kinase n=1 Tax=Okeanomitos corallinicola TIOX110 TaxID=3133117 RepID=A0ABZ2UP37_9CYAN